MAGSVSVLPPAPVGHPRRAGRGRGPSRGSNGSSEWCKPDDMLLVADAPERAAR
jgi:hypothetical protein